MTTAGTGHAIRCLRLIRTLKYDYICIVNKSNDAIKFLDNHGIENYLFEDDFSSLNPPIDEAKCIISDVNYLGLEWLDIYARTSDRIVCLAPRGSFKYHCGLSFKDTMYSDLEKSGLKFKGINYSGLDYCILDPSCLKSRTEAKELGSIVISMGGKDHFNMTMAALRSIEQYSFNIEVILGPMYRYIDDVEKFQAKYKGKLSIHIDPPEIYSIIAKCYVGIFGSGITTYEALCLGCIPLNIGHSDFHKMRATELEKFGLGYYIGDIRHKVNFPELGNLIFSLHQDERNLKHVSNSAMTKVDGQGIHRICNIISNYIDGSN